MSDVHSNGPQPGVSSNADPQTDANGASPNNGGSGSGGDQPKQARAQEITNPPRVGDKDTSGALIENIYASTRQFVIYEAGSQVRYLLPEDFDVAKSLRLKIAELGGLRASIEDWRCDPI